MKSRLGLALVLLYVAGALFLGDYLRDEMGLELTAESERDFVAGLGWKAPMAFVLLLTFRGLLLIPSLVVLTAGGLLFGAVAGTLLGALGVLLSGLMKFGVAHIVGREWIRPRLGEGYLRFERRVEAAGPIVIAAATAHPMGPMTPFHWAAGFATMAWITFIATVTMAGAFRAFACAYFGSTLVSVGSPSFWLATLLLAAVVLLPMAHPSTRRRLFPAAAQRP